MLRSLSPIKRQLLIAILAAIITFLVTKRKFIIPNCLFIVFAPKSLNNPYKYSWLPNEPAQLIVYVSEAPIQVTFDDPESQLVLQQQVKLGNNIQETISATVDVPVNPSWSLQNPLFAHIFLCRKNALPTQFPYPASDCVYRRHSLIHYRPPSQQANMLSLHHKVTSSESQESGYWHSNLDIVIVDFNDSLDIGTVHPFLKPMISLDYSASNIYQPIIFSNNFWKLSDQFIPVSKLTQNNTSGNAVTSLNVTVTHSSFFKFKWQQIFDRAIKQQPRADFEVFKRAFVDSSPLLLAITAIATLLHTLFDFLSFKNGMAYHFTSIRHSILEAKEGFQRIITSIYPDRLCIPSHYPLVLVGE